MASFRRRATGFAAAVSVFVLAVAGLALSPSSSSASEPTRATVHQVAADHDAAVTARSNAERGLLDLRAEHSRLLLLAWISVLLIAAVRARTAGRTIVLAARRVRAPVALRQQYDRGPPLASFA